MKLGAELFLQSPEQWIVKTERIGLLTHDAAVLPNLQTTSHAFIKNSSLNLTALFGPEHGFNGAAQDMESVVPKEKRENSLSCFNLYGKTFESLSPTINQLESIDVLIVDLQDIGSRYYTYAATMALCMKACGENNIRVIVLDRPNPIDGTVTEGGGLDKGLENFCALYPIPQRHGLTIGELAKLYQKYFDVHCELEVITCKGWNREQYFDSLSLPWVMPSPNMPTLDTAIVYPGLCLIEGTQISEGRGTTRPFELIGAPFVNSEAWIEKLKTLDLPGVQFRATSFKPMFQKCAGQLCKGFQLHVTDRKSFQPYTTGLALLWSLKQLWPEDFRWRTEMYEFRDDVPAIDLLTGKPEVRKSIDRGQSFQKVLAEALQGAEKFHEKRDKSLLY